ncbi:uncharacterized protein EDB91DRAFT_1088723 [Suillus paluster]|uniref:uncharacterized protein n=1 Tax=Suillus paluster TaxID=48578 RepID=UPI001B872277|nr:uncharacterized protein EDB91DRAFT_1088723 [Suillus paluster]KAG1720723.1 hypothetical protein EDB91DRAFT_1088723 [Suillus paluster]
MLQNTSTRKENMVARYFTLCFTSENKLSKIHQHVAEHADVTKILSDHSTRASHIVWTTLLDCITCHYHNKGVTEEEYLLAFARDKGPTTAFINELSSAGFFGSKGEHVIVHTLEAMFCTSTIPLDAIQPLDIKKFTHSFLVPYVATCAIAHRLNVSITEAHTMLLESRQAGIQLHPALDSDEELAISKSICRSNIQRSKSNTIVIHRNEAQGGPPRFRSRTWRAETTPPPQPGPSRHANALKLSDCASQGNPSSLSALSSMPPGDPEKSQGSGCVCWG